ncbi:MAG TPA: sugar phosphate nucleotidyltransferase [Patescibacteria group bacterium]|nr:sugar phosphate nucleotidyltransferase [Patescibacteria group bacterium]
MKAVIFAGGVGTRLWPLSRKHTPKQFEKIIDEKSTLQLAYDRISPIFSPSDIFISSGDRYADILYSQLPDIPRENFILEPEMRDVGAAVGLVGAVLEKIAPDEPFIILWSDHLVKNEALFRKILQTAGKILEDEPSKIVFIGQKSRLATQNLGWIEFGEKARDIDGLSLYEFVSLQYRPTLDRAEEFHQSDRHAWNPGYFGTTPRFLMSLYEKYAGEMYNGLKTIANDYQTENFTSSLKSIFPSFEKISFDNLILEKLNASDGYVIGADFGWSDIGAWEQLKEALSSSEDENVTRGKVMLEASSDSLVFNHTEQMVVGIDLSEFLVINTDDVVLVCPKNSVPKIKKLVESLAGTEHEKLT